jgi:hypothetical protein
MTELREFQEVRVARLLRPIDGRYLDSSLDPPPSPRIGETGCVVEIVDTRILVEHVDGQGATIWLCEFDREELEAL